MRNIAFALMLVCMMVGCGTPQRVVKIEHVLVAPEDNLMVDCDIAPPPAKADYLKDYTVGAVVPAPAVPKGEQYYLAQYARGLKNAEERERMLADANLKNIKNLDVCNQRWAKLRKWKVDAKKELEVKEKPR